jgi:hypothetical protein
MRSLALAIVVVAACDNHHEARVGPALLPQANLTAPLPPGATPVAVMPGAAPSLPAGPAALAIDVNVPWAQVAAQVRATPAPTLVVGRYRNLRAFTLEDELDAGPAIKITATAQGKFCVGPPGTDLAYCLERPTAATSARRSSARSSARRWPSTTCTRAGSTSTTTSCGPIWSAPSTALAPAASSRSRSRCVAELQEVRPALSVAALSPIRGGRGFPTRANFGRVSHGLGPARR